MKFKTIFYLLDTILFPLLVILLLFPPAAPGQSSQPVPVTVEAAPLAEQTPVACGSTPAALDCAEASLDVDLIWLNSDNQRAVSAILTLQTSAGVLQRTVDVAGSANPGDPARVHFVFAADTRLEALEILWPDGNLSTVTELPSHHLLRIIR